MIKVTLQAVTTNKDIKTNYGILKAGTVIGGIRETSLRGLSTVTVLHIIMNFQKGIVYEYGIATSFKVPTESLSIIPNCVYKTILGARMIKPKNLPGRLTPYTVEIYGNDFKKVIGEVMASDYFLEKRRFFNTSLYVKIREEWYCRVINADKSLSGWIKSDDNKIEAVSTWSDFVADVANVVVQQPLQAVREGVETIQENAGTFKTLLGLAVLIGVISIFKN